ncbi:probable G-protein coupled receptor B0563.6 [Centruroides vittatus]|uniref:probable G-protein coupled receptor B0563.6 n=1 Tax=Centruroides vittatus TaxID=120091 RepID=UPI00350EFF5D
MDINSINETLQEIISNVTSDTGSDINQLFEISYGFIIPAIVSFGIISNILNIITLSKPSLNKTPYMFIKARSVSDLLLLLTIIPFTIQNLTPDEEWNNYYIVFYFAKLQLLFVNSLVGNSSLYVTALTIERYISICEPLKVLQENNRKRILIVIILIPVFTVLFHVPYTLNFYIQYDYNSSNVTLYYFRDDDNTRNATFYQLYLLVLQSIFRIGPTLLIATLNLKIVVEYRKILNKRLKLSKTNSSDRLKEEERRLMFLLCGMSLMFFICNTPAAILVVITRDSLQKNYDFQVFRTIANLLEISNGSLSFVTYLASSRDFRRAAFDLKFHSRNRVSNVS